MQQATVNSRKGTTIKNNGKKQSYKNINFPFQAHTTDFITQGSAQNTIRLGHSQRSQN